MKISESQLIKIIKEEISKFNEVAYEPGRAVAGIEDSMRGPALDDRAGGWLEEAAAIMREIVDEGHGTSPADDVDYAIYKVGEFDPAAEDWLTKNKARVLAMHPANQ